MKITKIYGMLVPPGKQGDRENPDPVIGTEVDLDGNLYPMLSGVYAKSDEECDIPVRFLMAEDGSQENAVRTDLVALIKKPSLEAAVKLAERLRDVTNPKSGVGLLFLILGSAKGEHKIVLSRFPADEGVRARVRGSKLDVELVERIFTRNQVAYKAAVYRGKSFATDFWDGFVVDLQTHAGHSASYWLKEFLLSDFKTTPRAGSRRLAEAMREAAKSTESLETKWEIISAMTLVSGWADRRVTPVKLFDELGLSREAAQGIIDQFPNETTLKATFVLDAVEFRTHARFRSVELDTGAILTAPTEQFENAFQREELRDGRVRFIATGRVVDEKVRGRA